MVAWLLVVHILGLVLWISGLVATTIVLSQLAQESSTEGRQALGRAQRRSMRALADPGALLTILAGIALISTNPGYFLHARWLHIKFTFVLLLIGVHVMIAVKGKAAAAGRGGLDRSLPRILMIFVLLLLLSILIATLPGAVYLT